MKEEILKYEAGFPVTFSSALVLSEADAQGNLKELYGLVSTPSTKNKPSAKFVPQINALLLKNF